MGNLNNTILTDNAIKTKNLLAIANSVLDNPFFSKEFTYLIKRLNITKAELYQCFLDYNLDIFEVKNSIYDSLAIRLVLHLHNQLALSWHTTKQLAILDLLNELQPQSIADIGFGVPTKYVKEYLQFNKQTKIMLCDYSHTAIEFAKTLLNLWKADWQDTINLQALDMREVALIGQHDVYMFQDSIEHIPNPTECLKKYIAISPQDAQFILSLPVGEIIPAHYMAWESDDEIVKWLTNCGLRVNKQLPIYVNLEVDLFAEPLGAHHHDLVVCCSKL